MINLNANATTRTITNIHSVEFSYFILSLCEYWGDLFSMFSSCLTCVNDTSYATREVFIIGIFLGYKKIFFFSRTKVEKTIMSFFNGDNYYCFVYDCKLVSSYRILEFHLNLQSKTWAIFCRILRLRNL